MKPLDHLKKIVGLGPRYPHVERDLAEAYGLAPEALKDVRTAQLERGTHWELVKNQVCYNGLGKAALEAALQIDAEKKPAAVPAEIPPPAADPAPIAPAAPDSLPNTAPAAAAAPYTPPQAGEIRTLVAVAKVRNKRILRARDQEQVAWVRMKDSKNFRAGMELKAMFLSGDQWELVGRTPRWTGKF